MSETTLQTRLREYADFAASEDSAVLMLEAADALDDKDLEIGQLRSWSQEDEIAVITGQRDAWQAECDRLRATIERVEALRKNTRSGGCVGPFCLGCFMGALDAALKGDK